MFSGFAHVWTPVALARALRPGRPLPVEVGGERLVLFRDASGAPAALVDRCPHRGVALSLGTVEDGCITCPFHGWQLDAGGQVRHVPWNPDAKSATLRATSVPVREAGQLLWIYTAPVEAAPSEPVVADAFARPDMHVSGFAVEWRTHWTRAMENMLDWPHLPFVHRRTIGRGMLTRGDARMDVHWEERPWGAHSTITIDGKPQPGALELRWPNMMNLYAPIGKRTLVLQVACLPLDGARTRMLVSGARDFLRGRLFDPLFDWMNRRIVVEDQAIVESSQPPEVPPAGAERSVRTDALPLHFRKRYFAELRASSVETAPTISLRTRANGSAETCQSPANVSSRSAIR